MRKHLFKTDEGLDFLTHIVAKNQVIYKNALVGNGSSMESPITEAKPI